MLKVRTDILPISILIVSKNIGTLSQTTSLVTSVFEDTFVLHSLLHNQIKRVIHNAP